MRRQITQVHNILLDKGSKRGTCLEKERQWWKRSCLREEGKKDKRDAKKGGPCLEKGRGGWKGSCRKANEPNQRFPTNDDMSQWEPWRQDRMDSLRMPSFMPREDHSPSHNARTCNCPDVLSMWLEHTTLGLQLSLTSFHYLGHMIFLVPMPLLKNKY